jgi:choline dehydrogenase-like flavoprotein
MMATSPTTQATDFTTDVLGRYVCNGLDEALQSANQNVRPDAQPFDIIVIGGGSFGPILAQYIFAHDLTHSHRVLVLEAGLLTLPEHVQNLPMLGLYPPGPTTNDPGAPRNEVWGLPWRSGIGFPGLAYCLGGRSVFFGGWSPQLLDAEMPAGSWPPAVVAALNDRYFLEAREQIGTNETNDFIHGELHDVLRQQLFDGMSNGQVTDAIPLAQLPLHLDVSRVSAGRRNLLKLEAPLAVQSQTRPGFFPFNKFSAVPLLMQAARAAQFESAADDVKKRVMIVPNCHVTRLMTAVNQGATHITEVLTSQGSVPVPNDGAVVIALGTIESARLALISFPLLGNTHLIGRNLIAHLRSNLNLRVPRSALTALDPAVRELQASALFVKGRHTYGDGTVGHFHLQLTASGLGAMGTNSEAELFKKVPDIDTFEALRAADDSHVVITIRGIGEMQAQNPDSRITLAAELDEFGLPRGFVSIADPQNPQQRAANAMSAKDFELWEAMDRASDDVAKVFAGNQPFEVFTPNGVITVAPGDNLRDVLPYTGQNAGGRRDGLGTTHHEAGPLWMGDDPSASVTNANGRFHLVDNAYVAGPGLFPTIGSPNPMLTGTALARRLGDHLIDYLPKHTPTADPGFTLLFDGVSTNRWRMSTIRNQPGRDDPGRFIVVNGALESVPGNDLGLYWYTEPTPADFILKLEWLRWQDNGNSGVFMRFPHPDSKGYDNTAYVGVHFGFEVQIDKFGAPDGADMHKTGAIYNEPSQTLALRPAHDAGQWNAFEIRVQGQTYTVFLNGDQVTTFQNPHPNRGLPTTTSAPSFIGLQAYPGSRVAFRNIQIKAL